MKKIRKRIAIFVYGVLSLICLLVTIAMINLGHTMVAGLFFSMFAALLFVIWIIIIGGE